MRKLDEKNIVQEIYSPSQIIEKMLSNYSLNPYKTIRSIQRDFGVTDLSNAEERHKGLIIKDGLYCLQEMGYLESKMVPSLFQTYRQKNSGKQVRKAIAWQRAFRLNPKFKYQI
jgi:hypothetical protein